MLRAEARADRALAATCRGRLRICPEVPLESAMLRIRIAHTVGDAARARGLFADLQKYRPIEELLALEQELTEPLGGDVPAGAKLGKRGLDTSEAANALINGRDAEAEALAMNIAFARYGDEDMINAFVILARIAERRGDDARARRMYARGFHAAPRGSLRPFLPSNDDEAAARRFPGLRLPRGECILARPDDGLLDERSTLSLAQDGDMYRRDLATKVRVERLGQFDRSSNSDICFGDGKTKKAYVELLDGDPREWQVTMVREDGTSSKARAHMVIPFQPFMFVAPDGSFYIPDRLGFNDFGLKWFRFTPGEKRGRPLQARFSSLVLLPLSGGDLVGTEEGEVIVMNGATGKVRRRYTNKDRPYNWPLAVSLDGQWLVTGEPSGGNLALLNLSTGERKETNVGSVRVVGAIPGGVVFRDKDGIWLVVRFSDGSVHEVNAIVGEQSFVRPPGEPWVRYSNKDRMEIVTSVDKRSFMAVDPEGYFEARGDRAAELREAASCSGWPIDLCADALERERVREGFPKGDLSYRDP